jgi:hypothetical protein
MLLKKWLEENHTKLLFDNETHIRQTIMNVADHDTMIYNTVVGYENLPDRFLVHVGWKEINDKDPSIIHTYEIEAKKA